jgi:DNA-binding response OmpR family regulator
MIRDSRAVRHSIPLVPRAQRVLVIDDEPRVREVVADYLEREGFKVSEAADAESAERHLQGPQPDLVILDIMFPGASGLDLLHEIRRSSDMPVILLTARVEEADRVLGLELGADDYVVKPFSPRELVARVRSVLRRANPSLPSTLLEFDGLSIDIGARQVSVGGEEVELTAREFDLLAYMASNPKQVFSRAQLLEQVWDSSPEWQDPATVTVHVRRVRHKIEEDPTDPRWLQTAWGVGYKFQP